MKDAPKSTKSLSKVSWCTPQNEMNLFVASRPPLPRPPAPKPYMSPHIRSRSERHKSGRYSLVDKDQPQGRRCGTWGVYLEVHGTYEPFITVLIAVRITTLGHLGGLQVGYRYSYKWVIRTMNLQVERVFPNDSLRVLDSNRMSTASGMAKPCKPTIRNLNGV